MKQIVLITGANGLFAKHLSKYLEKDYFVRFLTRNATKKNEFNWNLKSNYIDPRAFESVDHIIHLAGTPILKNRWTENIKKKIVSSRIDSSKLLLRELIKHKIVLKSYISASATGFYGTINSKTIFTEESSRGKDFLSDVCYKWENAANSFKLNSVAENVSIVRIGAIFSKKGGALEKIVKPIKYGFGIILGSGNQYIPWIHIQDLCGIVKFLIDSKNINGVFNATSPEHLKFSNLIKNVGNILGKKIILLKVPEFIIRVFLGKKAEIFLKGSRVSSEKIVKMGYDFKFKKITSDLVG